MKNLTEQLQNGQDLTPDDIRVASDFLLEEEASVGDRVAFLGALADKGETPDEIAGFVRVFLEKAVDPGVDVTAFDRPTLDVCGTGGDKLDLFNVSTTSIFVLAAGGAVVAKHGNKGITSKSGSSDVLSALGIPVDLSPEKLQDCLGEVGVAFLFAPHYHPAFKAVVPVRAELAGMGKRTVFNLLGPLLNPVKPDYQLVGVFAEELGPVFAEILGKLGRKAAWAVHGKTADGRGVDELSTMGPNGIWKSCEGQVEAATLSIDETPLMLAQLEELQGGTPEENAAIVEGILSGAVQGPKRDIVLLNAAAGFVVTGICETIAEGVEHAAGAIDSGSAMKTLSKLRSFG